MAPIVVDPQVLAGAGSAVGGVGDELAAAVGTLGSALASNGAMAGDDAAGRMFGQAYEQAAQGVLNAVDAGVNASRKVGFGVAMSASNYSRAEAASTIGGGEALPAPAEPAGFAAPRVPSPFGSGVVAPALWSVVEMFVGGVWPDGDPAELRAAAGAWQGLGASITGAAGELSGPAGVISGQQIDEGPAMTSALSKIGSGLSKIAVECGQLATQLNEFADEVQSAQDAIRDLLHRLGTPQGLLGEVVAVFKGHGLDEVKKIADDIKKVLHNLKRQADARQQGLQQAMAGLDGAVVAMETYTRHEFTHYLGEDVGNKVATVFDTFVNTGEGALKQGVALEQGAEELNPLRFAYDPKGAASTWNDATKTGAIEHILNPEEAVKADEQLGRGLLHLDDWRRDRPGLGFGENLLDVGTLLVPGAGGLGAGAKGAEVAASGARGAEVEADAAGAIGRAAGGRAAEAASGATGALNPITEQSGKLAADLDKVGDTFPAGAQAGTPGKEIPPSVLDHTPPQTPTGRGLPDGRAPEPPQVEHAPAPAGAGRPETPTGPHETAPVGGHPASAPGGVHEPAPPVAEHAAPAPAGEHSPPTAPHVTEPAPAHAPASPEGHPVAPAPPSAHAPQTVETPPAPREPIPDTSPGSPGGAHPPEPPAPPHDTGGLGGGDRGSEGDYHNPGDGGGGHDGGADGGGGGHGGDSGHDGGGDDGHGGSVEGRSDGHGYSPHAPEVASNLNDALVNGHPTSDLAREVADLSTHHMPSPTDKMGNADRVVLGMWDGQDGGYIGEARHNGGIYFDTGAATWEAMERGLDGSQVGNLGWEVNEQFLRAQLENGVTRIDYILDHEKYLSLEDLVVERAGSYSAMEIEFLIKTAAAYGYERFGDSWVHVKGRQP